MIKESPLKKTRSFLPNSFTIKSWDDVRPYFEKLLEFNIHSFHDLKTWLQFRSELDAMLEEEMAWRYIKMNIDTADEQLAQHFNFFVEEIEPHIAPLQNKLDQKLVESPLSQELGQEYLVYLKSTRTKINIYRNKNIPLLSKLQVESQKYGSINAAMTILVNQEEVTLQRASVFLKDKNRELRKEVFMKIEGRRELDAPKLQSLMNILIELRHQVAQNADYSNYRDYMFDSMCRFYYTKKDCFHFHNSVKNTIVPLLEYFILERKKALNYDNIMPWDTEVDPYSDHIIKPFNNAEELVKKTIQIFYKLDPDFGDCITMMNDCGYLDLDSKKGKAPGGFNYPLFESGLPFIYMNSVGLLRDLITMLHEGGHAVHSYLTNDLPITELKSFPSEVAELASMSMELITLDYWDIFFSDPQELRRAKREHLQKVVQALPWIAVVDKFQHWIYENPTHTIEQRNETWYTMIQEFSSHHINWSGLEHVRKQSWLKQLHIFEVPFYYIEYGFAQLGAIAVWKNYKTNPQKAIQQYKTALSLGNTRSIPEIYEAAGIQFKFDEHYVKELADFVLEEIKKI